MGKPERLSRVRHQYAGRPGGWCEVDGCQVHHDHPIHYTAAEVEMARIGDANLTSGADTEGATGVPDDDWGDLTEGQRIGWRIGVLDKDLLEDPDAIVEHAAHIAGWYVHDCDHLLNENHALRVELAEQVRRLAQADRNWEEACARRDGLQERVEILHRAHRRAIERYQQVRDALADLRDADSSHAAHDQAVRRADELLGRGEADG